ncbi:MAG: sulfotransferase [Thermoguttaceae bacterium]|nr:sulfotransferase [Thermoguttaceae bacterium]
MSTMLRVPQKPPSAEKTGSPAMPWHPRMWHGMTMGAWLKTLARHRPAISPSRWVLAGTISMSTPVNSALAALQQMLHGRRIRSLAIDKAPIFILGHWRSGTTLLHELLVLDERHTYPNTYACYTPRHFLVSRYLVPWWLKFLMPARRPMDNMKVGWNRPQEDEFAMCNMGVPSPYLAFAFPNIPNIGSAYFDLKKISPAELAEWKQAFVYFLKCVTLAGGGRRVVLKTPLHTCRVDLLREIFPDARFVHIVRDPYVIFPSTVRTWQRLSEDEGLQRPTHEGLEEQVLANFARMYAAFERSKPNIAPKRFCEVRYEDLIDDPVGRVREIYENLELDGFAEILPALQEKAAGMRGYQVTRHRLSREMHEQITRRWADFIDRYQYADSAIDSENTFAT